MKRRDFIAATAATALTTGVTGQALAETAGHNSLARTKERTPSMSNQLKQRDLIEIRTFWVADDQKKETLIAKLDDVYIPLRRKLGYKQTGVFSVNRELHADDAKYDPIYNKAVFVVGSVSSFEPACFFQINAVDALSLDQLLNKSSNERLYEDMEAELVLAFPGCPALEIPTRSKERVVQYRRYNSPNIERHQAKVRMFDVRGELALFRRLGLNPVFFGEMIFGKVMPNVSYMLAFDNDADRKKAWAAFIGSNEWKTMKAEEQFKDTATRIRNLFLKPSPKSEI
ncbi:MAG: NIPSNAP family protein [Thermoguttaceae bacterium]|nr:NIPSNAP family protein [Thermoguttaceae bacterium]